MLNVGNYVKITFVLQDMPIGYKCINSKDIARIVMEMLRASVEQTGLLILLLNAKKKIVSKIYYIIYFSVSTINSYDLVKKFQERVSLYIEVNYFLSMISFNRCNFLQAVVVFTHFNSPRMQIRPIQHF